MHGKECDEWSLAGAHLSQFAVDTCSPPLATIIDTDSGDLRSQVSTASRPRSHIQGHVGSGSHHKLLLVASAPQQVSR